MQRYTQTCHSTLTTLLLVTPCEISILKLTSLVRNKTAISKSKLLLVPLELSLTRLTCITQTRRRWMDWWLTWSPLTSPWVERMELGALLTSHLDKASICTKEVTLRRVAVNTPTSSLVLTPSPLSLKQGRVLTLKLPKWTLDKERRSSRRWPKTQ